LSGEQVNGPFRIDTGIGIAAPPQRVWDILTDFPRYALWNPWIVGVEGDLTPGAALHLKSVHVPGQPPTDGLVLLVSAAFPEMRWEGGHPDREILKGDHLFRCEAAEGGCRFRHVENFTGMSAERLVQDYGARMEANFHRFNRALKAFAEQ
jgi:hypothetical protein